MSSLPKVLPENKFLEACTMPSLILESGGGNTAPFFFFHGFLIPHDDSIFCNEDPSSLVAIAVYVSSPYPSAREDDGAKGDKGASCL